jgi:HSP20 family protein
MNTQISVPKELLAQIDFNNTVNGGMVQHTATAWQTNEGYHLLLKAPGIDINDLHIKAVDQRFVVYYMIDVLDKTEQMPYYLVNLPLSPEVDLEAISAHEQGKDSILIIAPFNNWSKGGNLDINIQKY